MDNTGTTDRVPWWPRLKWLALICLLIFAGAVFVALHLTNQIKAQFEAWPDPAAYPAHYGLPAATETAAQYSPWSGQWGYQQPEVDTDTQTRRAHAYSAYRTSQDEIYKLEDRRSVAIGIAGIALAFPVLIFVFSVIVDAILNGMAKVTRVAAPEIAKVGVQAVKAAQGLTTRSPSISHGDLSTADELRKWVQLREEGLVTDEEFQEMRTKLLGARSSTGSTS